MSSLVTVKSIDVTQRSICLKLKFPSWAEINILIQNFHITNRKFVLPNTSTPTCLILGGFGRGLRGGELYGKNNFLKREINSAL